jgi:hypothetical protein
MSHPFLLFAKMGSDRIYIGICLCVYIVILAATRVAVHTHKYMSILWVYRHGYTSSYNSSAICCKV